MLGPLALTLRGITLLQCGSKPLEYTIQMEAHACMNALYSAIKLLLFMTQPQQADGNLNSRLLFRNLSGISYPCWSHKTSKTYIKNNKYNQLGTNCSKRGQLYLVDNSSWSRSYLLDKVTHCLQNCSLLCTLTTVLWGKLVYQLCVDEGNGTPWKRE